MKSIFLRQYILKTLWNETAILQGSSQCEHEHQEVGGIPALWAVSGPNLSTEINYSGLMLLFFFGGFPVFHRQIPGFYID
jgi:hypothetical protein